MSTESELRDERVKLLYKKMIRSVSTNSSVSGAELGVLAGSNAINGKSSVQQEDIYAASIPSSYTTSESLLGALTVLYEYSSGTVVNKYTGTYPSTWVAASPASFNPATAKTNINTYGLTTDLWQAFIDGDLSRVYTFVDTSTSSVVVYVEKLILDEVSATLEGGSPTYGHPVLADAIQFSTSGGAYVGKIESQYATTSNYFTVDTIGNWVLQSDCGTLQFFDQGATYRLGSLNSNNPCNLFAVSGATTDVWFNSAKPPVISFWKYIGKKGSNILTYYNRYNFIESKYDTGLAQSVIDFYEYSGGISSTYDARLYASAGSLVADAATVRFTPVAYFNISSSSIALTVTPPYGSFDISGVAVDGSLFGYVLSNSKGILKNPTTGGIFLYDCTTARAIVAAFSTYFNINFNGSTAFQVVTTYTQNNTALLTVGNFIQSTGYRVRQGTSGGFGTLSFNIYWSNPYAQLWYSTAIFHTAFGTWSDYRIKGFIEDLPEGAKYKMLLLRPVTYEFKTSPGIPQHGFIAHEVQEIIPIAVSGEKDQVDETGKPVMQHLDYIPIVAVLTKAIQELYVELLDLQQRIEVLTK